MVDRGKYTTIVVLNQTNTNKMTKALKTIKIYIEEEDDQLFKDIQAVEGVTLQHQYTQAVKEYAAKLRKEGGQDGR